MQAALASRNQGSTIRRELGHAIVRRKVESPCLPPLDFLPQCHSVVGGEGQIPSVRGKRRAMHVGVRFPVHRAADVARGEFLNAKRIPADGQAQPVA